MQRNSFSGNKGHIFLALVLFNFISSYGFAEEYAFERMWPIIQQPWYMDRPGGLALDPSDKYFYLADGGYYQVQKYTRNGEFVTKWGFPQWTIDVAVNDNGEIYVAGLYSIIQKFSSDGEFIVGWGSYGTSDGQFTKIIAISIDSDGYVYVVDQENNRIQKFDSEGKFIQKWGSQGSENGQFNEPSGIVIDSNNFVYVIEHKNKRIQKFNPDGEFVLKWTVEEIYEDDMYQEPGIAIDKEDCIYVDTHYGEGLLKYSSDGKLIGEVVGAHGNLNAFDIANDGVIFAAQDSGMKKYGNDGEVLAEWSGRAEYDGEPIYPGDIAYDKFGNVYVVDGRHRVFKFSSNGELLDVWSTTGKSAGYWFGSSSPYSIAIDSDDYVYITYTGGFVVKFTSNGEYVTHWGNKGSNVGEFSDRTYIAIDSEGMIYLADSGNDRIQKFASNGEFIKTWSSESMADSDFSWPNHICIDHNDILYVEANDYIYKFTNDGELIKKWDPGEKILSMTVDQNGNIFTALFYTQVIKKYTPDFEFVTEIGGEKGSEPGQLYYVDWIRVTPQSEVYISDRNGRVQTFTPSKETTVHKAILLAGSGPYDGNQLWDATQVCANYAYRSLTYQGYTKDTIYYLSADTDLDLNADGIPEVDADATNASFEYAIKTWAKDADDLFIYMVGHGGEGTFRMKEFELLYASELDSWLDTVQQSITGFVALVYDGCHSGSFLPLLTPISGKERIVVTSAAAGERAVFQDEGMLSFGFQFFACFFGGGSFYDSFVHGKTSVLTTYDSRQNPQLDGNGNGVGNEKLDKQIASAVKVGNEAFTAEDIPSIERVSPEQKLGEGESSALIFADNVIDANGIEKVFAVIKPPDYSSGSTENPVTGLPEIDLKSVGNNRYEATYSDFTVKGTYNIAIFARDRRTVLSLPKQTSVTAVGGCPVCGGSDVTISNQEFGADINCECTATNSIKLGNGVKIKQGATMIFKIEE